MPETQSSIFDETDAFILPPRRALLPWWIIFFCWFFIILCPFDFIFMVLQHSGRDLSMYGVEAKTGFTFKEVFSLVNSLLTLVVAYGLLREKDWAVNIAIINALISVADGLFSINDPAAGVQDDIDMAISWFTLAFGLIMLGIYLLKLFRIRQDWRIRLPRRSL